MIRRPGATARIALVAMLLALASNLALLAFIHLRTADDALTELTRQTVSEAAAFAPLAARGDRAALARAIDRRLAEEDDFALAGLIDPDGRPGHGDLAATPPAAVLRRPGFQIADIWAAGDPGPAEAGVVVRPVAGGRGWLVIGRTFDEGLALQRTLRRALLLAVLLALGLGAACGAVLARYVGGRIGRIADVADAVGEGDLNRRVAIAPGHDPFDRLGGQINRMLDRIGALMEELRLLTDSLAHDLRSPVGRLRARIEQALATGNERERDRLLAGVLVEADALTRILTTVMEIGRLEAGAAKRQFEPLDPAALLADLADMYEPLAEEAGVAMAVEADTGLPPFTGHRQLLAQALGNLIDNALRYAAAGGRLTLIARATWGGLAVGVVDRGPGIADDDRATARRRFGRLDAARSLPGAGLGLPLVEAVAHLHGGVLRLEDAGPGLAATLDLPAAAPQTV